MIHIRGPAEVSNILISGQIVKRTLEVLEKYIVPGMETLELDRIAEEYIRGQDAIPGFKGLYGFPATLCISIDDEVVHGIPGKRKLKEGEIVGIDVGVLKNKYYGDHARTFAVGKISEKKQKLIDITRECLSVGIQQAIPGKRIGDIGFAIQKHAEKNGFSVVRELVGHGIGTDLHEEPQIPNFGKKNRGALIDAGMCFAIEPMINMGQPDVRTLNDGWTVVTHDGLPSAHFEHTVTITANGPEVLTN